MPLFPTRRAERTRPQLPKKPFRDAVLVYGVLAVVIVVIAAATGSSVGRAAVVAVLFFALSVTWTLWRVRQRLRDGESSPDDGGDGGD